MNTAMLEDLMLSALESPVSARLEALLKAVDATALPLADETAEKFDILWEGWGDARFSNDQAVFCCAIAERQTLDSPLLRKAMVNAAKARLPQYLDHNPVIRAIGVRDEKLPLRAAAGRLRRILALNPGSVVFLPGSKSWGTIGTIDHINATIPVSSFCGLGSSRSMPLAGILDDVIPFKFHKELEKIALPAVPPLPAALFRTVIGRYALLPLSDEEQKMIAQYGCAARLQGPAFDAYWAAASGKNAAPAARRRSCDGRSLQEMDLLLSAEEQDGAAAFTADECAAFKAFFTRLKPETARRESKLLASVVAKVCDRARPEDLTDTLSPLLGKAAFWPEHPDQVPLRELEVWGELPAKSLDQLAAATARVFPGEYLAGCAMRLPLKALNSICEKISDEELYDTVCATKACGADLLLWIWKNRRKRPSEELLALVNLENVVRVLGAEDPPKAWGAARRELRSMLMDKADFQTRLIEAAEGNAAMFSAVLQGALFLSTSERQSLMVKLSRISDEFRNYLENGAGRKILSAGIGKPADVRVPTTEAVYTSSKSHQALMKELDDIINIHVPENREALKTARAHGDFRENSEFDAAKERRNHLSRRRSELERELALIQPVIMSAVKVDNHAEIGTEIELEYDDGSTETFYLLGAWDGDPERHFLSYRTRLGAAVRHAAVGDRLELPGGRKCILKAVRPLPAEIVAELDA